MENRQFITSAVQYAARIPPPSAATRTSGRYACPRPSETTGACASQRWNTVLRSIRAGAGLTLSPGTPVRTAWLPVWSRYETTASQTTSSVSTGTWRRRKIRNTPGGMPNSNEAIMTVAKVAAAATHAVATPTIPFAYWAAVQGKKMAMKAKTAAKAPRPAMATRSIRRRRWSSTRANRGSSQPTITSEDRTSRTPTSRRSDGRSARRKTASPAEAEMIAPPTITSGAAARMPGSRVSSTPSRSGHTGASRTGRLSSPIATQIPSAT